MEPTTKKAADRVNKHREDGEEAVKRRSKVVPIDSEKERTSKDSQSVQVTPDTKPQSGKK